MTNTSATNLIICPATVGAPQATTYLVLLPHDGRYSVLWSMWCSSLRWALQDAAQDFRDFFNEMFPEGHEVHYYKFNSRKEILETVRTMNLEQAYDPKRLAEIRAKYNLPPWSCEPDPYRQLKW